MFPSHHVLDSDVRFRCEPDPRIDKKRTYTNLQPHKRLFRASLQRQDFPKSTLKLKALLASREEDFAPFSKLMDYDKRS